MDVRKVRRAVFSRHSHPVSAWTRWATIPLVVAPFWSRRADVTAGVLAWFALNPVMTPTPATKEAFATRAMLGEELWLADPSRDRSMTPLNVAGSAVLGGAILAGWRRWKVPTMVGVAAAMALTLISWQRYADVYDAEQDSR